MSEFSQAKEYDGSMSSLHIEDGKTLISLLAPEKGDKILDIGCGTGELTKLLADMVGPEGNVIGIDPDVERLELARAKYSADNLEYIEGTAECIPADDGSFDIIFSDQVFHWCKDKDAIFKQAVRKLKPGGKLGFVTINNANVFGSSLTLDLVSKEVRDAYINSFHGIDLSQYLVIAAKNSFEVLFSEECAKRSKITNVSELVSFYMTHLHGKYDQTHFNIEAMKQKYGEGEFTIGKDSITCVMKLVA